MRYLLLFIAFLFISCSEEYSRKFVGQGNSEPFWNIEIKANDYILLNKPGEFENIKFDFDKPIKEGYLMVVENDSTYLDINILDRDCPDRMSGDLFKNQIIIRINDEKFIGCGGFVSPPKED